MADPILAAAASAPATGETSTATTTDTVQTETATATATAGSEQKQEQQTTQEGTQPESPKDGEAKAQETAPAEIEVKLQEGVEVDGEIIEAIKGAAKDSEAAQKLADTVIAAQARATEKLTAEINQQYETWKQAVKTDKEIGGEKWARTEENARRVFQRFGTPELSRLMTIETYGSNPEIVRLLARVGEALRDDTVAKPVAQLGSIPSEEERLRRLYPTMHKE